MGKCVSAFPAEKKVPSPQGGNSLSPSLSEGTKGAKVGNKRKWYPILLIGLVLLPITLVIGCSQAYSEADLDVARQATYEAGYTQGYSAGYIEGYDIGHNKGYDTGKADGYEAGHNEGYDAGLIELESVKQEAEKLGYDKGFEAGIAMARQEAAREALETLLPAETLPEDLAYIKTWVSNYSDDATPEPNGISLRIWFYDSKSELIAFRDIPLIVTFKLYNFGFFPDSPPENWEESNYSGEPLYQDMATINFSSESIKIPFENLKITPRTSYSSYHNVGVKVTVTTPNQRDFSVTSLAIIKLY